MSSNQSIACLLNQSIHTLARSPRYVRIHVRVRTLHPATNLKVQNPCVGPSCESLIVHSRGLGGTPHIDIRQRTFAARSNHLILSMYVCGVNQRRRYGISALGALLVQYRTQ